MIIKKPEQQSNVIILLPQSVPEIQSSMFIKMYSPVTMTTCVALDYKEKTK